MKRSICSRITYLDISTFKIMILCCLEKSGWDYPLTQHHTPDACNMLELHNIMLQEKKSFWKSKWRWWCSSTAPISVWWTESEYIRGYISSFRFATLLARQSTKYVTPDTTQLILPNPERPNVDGGVISCWLIEPNAQTSNIYRPGHFKTCQDSVQ